MTKYYQQGNIYVALMEKSEISVTLNKNIGLFEFNMEYFYKKNDYTTITAEAFNAAYRQTKAMINAEFSRLMMIQTDELVPEATESEKREEHQRYPADDEYRGEHMEFDC
jgi:hypothetical protein